MHIDQLNGSRARRVGLWVLRFVAGSALVGIALFTGRYVAAYWKEHDRQLERLMRTTYMLDGSVDINSERSKGLFSGEELDSIKKDFERLKASEREYSQARTLPPPTWQPLPAQLPRTFAGKRLSIDAGSPQGSGHRR